MDMSTNAPPLPPGCGGTGEQLKFRFLFNFDETWNYTVFQYPEDDSEVFFLYNQTLPHPPRRGEGNDAISATFPFS